MNLTSAQKSKLISMYPELRDWLEQRETNQLLSSLFSSISMMKGDKGDRGEKGDRGDRGEKPTKGKDYFTDQEVSLIAAHILEVATPKKGIHYDDGSDYVLTQGDKKEIANLIEVPIVDKVVEKIEVIKEVLPASIDVSFIKGAVSKKDLESTTKKIESGMALVNGRIKLIDQRWHGAGLSRVTTDTTLTGLGTPASPLSVVGGGGGFTVLEPTETPNGVRTVFTFSAATGKPTFVVSDNATLQATSKSGTVNWTWNSGTLQATMTIPPQDDICAIQ